MKETFDPYREWLKVTHDARPLSFYQLLGISEYEHDEVQMERAFQEQVKRINQLLKKLDKDKTRLAKRVLTELESARSCLTDSESRASYNAQLKSARNSKFTTSLNVARQSTTIPQHGAPSNSSALSASPPDLLNDLLDDQLPPPRPELDSPLMRKSAAPKPFQRFHAASVDQWIKHACLGVALLLAIVLVSGGVYSFLFSSAAPELPEEEEAPPVASGVRAPRPTVQPTPTLPVQASVAASTIPSAAATPAPPALAVPVEDSNYFADLPTCVELPAIVEETIRQSSPLIQFRVPGKHSIELLLHNFDSRAGTIKYQINKDRENSWLVFHCLHIGSQSELNNRAEKQRVGVAKMALSGNGIAFQWLDEARSVDANRLRNCLLQIQVAEQSGFVQLRLPVRETAAPLDLHKVKTSMPLVGEAMPELSDLRLEVLRCSGFPHPIKYDPATQARNDEVRIVVQSGIPGIEIRLKMQENAGKASISMSPLIVDASGKTLSLTTDRIETMERTLPKELSKARDKLSGLQAQHTRLVGNIRNAESALSNPQQHAQANIQLLALRSELNKVSGQIAVLSKKLPILAKRLEAVKSLSNTAKQINGRATIAFRVCADCNEHQIDFLKVE